MLWVKALHIVFVASWFAGLFYLPRIFVNMAMETNPDINERLLVMARTFNTLVKKCDSEHDAHHHIMECLGEMLWVSQRNGTPPDGLAYVECVRRRAQA